VLQFLKILARNLLQGPSTEAFPYQEAPTPKRLRGRVTMDPQKCVGCGICRHVCAGRAINIQKNEQGTGYDYVIWHNSCALCGLCRHHCPTGAITLLNDWHSAHAQADKYNWAEHHFVPYLRCAECGAYIRLIPPELATRLYAHSPVDMTKLMKLCPACRQKAEAVRMAGVAATRQQGEAGADTPQHDQSGVKNAGLE
jgi:formate hydrogenlyase subunit 6/NADH:ubiquinone oxidoreductase subunit I